jgi:SPOR domain
VIEAEVERYSDPETFAREVNLPLLGSGAVEPVRAGATVSTLLSVEPPLELATVVDRLDETRRSLTLRSLLLAGFPEDAECFAVGLALAREWTRRGRKLAVVDLDFWNPTVLRPLPHANEGFVDVLEYGCSFRRVAWEIVAGSLWLIGPGSYPPDPARLTEHPDWERASRGFAAHVDVVLFVAPLLHRTGFVGRLSKRMDGVLLAASVERIARSDLRDAFLELWGSDAPIIGCVGIRAEEGPAWIEPPLWSERETDAKEAPPPEPERARTEPSANGRTEGAADLERELASLLEEVKLGHSTVRPIRRSRAGLYAGIALALAVLAGVLAVVTHHPTLQNPPEALPAGMEPVLPAPDRPNSAGAAVELPAAAGGASSNPAEVKAPPAKAPPAKAPPVKAPPEGATPFRVHVASFKSVSKVREIVQELERRGEDAWYERADGAPYYRVFVGRYATEAEARAHARWLLDKHWVDRATTYPQTER